MSDPSDPRADNEITGRIMDKAATANRRALFAALQAALGPIVDAEYGGYRGGGLQQVEEALELGAEAGSPEHLEHVARKCAEHAEDAGELDR